MELGTLGRYTVRCKLGEGGMATVHRAWDPEMQRDVAIKVLRPELIRDGNFLQRFQREMEVTWKLDHPNVVRVFDAGRDEATGLHFFVMELLDGITAYDAVFQKARVSLDVAVRIVLDILAALGHAHEHGLIHRDLKLENIMLCRDGRVVLTDFGVARPEGSKLTRVSQRVGTPIYMAPEQVKGEDVDHRTDLYACGVAFFELVTGRLPFEGKDDVDTSHLHVTAPPPKPSSICKEVPPSVDRVFLKTMAKRREARWQSAGEMAEALRAAMDEAGWTVAGHVDPDALPKWPPLPKPVLPGRETGDPGGTSSAEFDRLLAPPTPEELGVAPARRERPSRWRGLGLVFVLVGALLAWLRFSQGYVTVTSYPDGAEVTAVELARWGRTPIAMRAVSTGRIRLRLQADGFADGLVEVEVGPGRMSNLHVILRPLRPGEANPSSPAEGGSSASAAIPSAAVPSVAAPSVAVPAPSAVSGSTGPAPSVSSAPGVAKTPAPVDGGASSAGVPPAGTGSRAAGASEPSVASSPSPGDAVAAPDRGVRAPEASLPAPPSPPGGRAAVAPPAARGGTPLQAALGERVRVLLREGRDGEAVSALRGACRTGLISRRDAAAVLARAGRERMDQLRLDAAEELLRWALRLDFSQVDAHLVLSRVFEKQGNFERCSYHLRKALGLAKASGAYLRRRAEMEALAVTVRPRKELLDQASLFLLEGQIDRGVEFLFRAAGGSGLDGASAAQSAFVAWKLLEWGRRFAEASASREVAPLLLRKSADLASAKTDAYEALALAYIEQEEEPKAYYFLREAVESAR